MSDNVLELDVRVIPPRDKHPSIFRVFGSLASGRFHRIDTELCGDRTQ
ncbi:MAG: hypothetical protein ABI601_20830 [bacterium]